VLGVIVHIVMLIMFLLLPSDIRFTIIKAIIPYVLILYPIFSVILGAIMFMKNDILLQNDLLLQSKENFERAIESAPIPMAIYNTRGEIIKVNNEFTQISGYDIKDIPTIQDWAEKAYKGRANKAIHNIHKIYETEDRVYEGEIKVYTKNNNTRLWDFYSSSIGTFPDSGKVILSIAIDVTDKKEINDRLEYLSFHDEMTGLYNRRFFETEVQRLHTKRNYPLAVLVGDINGLKVVNDSFGHLVGDELIIAAAKTLKNAFRSDDIIARIGGDEFVILLPKTSEIETETLVERIVRELEMTFVQNLQLSISFGTGYIYSEEDTYEKAFIDAENKMYKNKMIDSPSVRGLTIDTILNTLFEKDGKTKIHSENVSKIAVMIAQELGYNHDKIQEIKAAGLLHDIGKIVTPLSILNKSTKLTSEDYEEILKHPEIGYRILDSGSNMGNIAKIVLHHHEHYDGTGYPMKIKGEAIPVESRIITIADAFEAMTNERIYRPALTINEAIEEIKRCKGTHFDPYIADVFINNVVNKK
ncbi:MAG: diguanylate cyclase, partial [Bacilli bacterium]|nr:diguanylate cyclase [Bacilli bacterium]